MKDSVKNSRHSLIKIDLLPLNTNTIGNNCFDFYIRHYFISIDVDYWKIVVFGITILSKLLVLSLDQQMMVFAFYLSLSRSFKWHQSVFDCIIILWKLSFPTSSNITHHMQRTFSPLLFIYISYKIIN